MIYLKDKKVYPYYGDYNPLSIYQGSKKIAGWVEKTADISSNIRIENGYSTMKVKPFGKSEQVHTEQGANLCPNVDSDKWVLSSGAYKENGYIVLPQAGAKAEIVVEWNGQTAADDGLFKCYWGAHMVTEDAENAKYQVEVFYLNEDKNVITSNGTSVLIGGVDVWKNGWFSYADTTSYGQAIRDAKYIKYRMIYSSSNTVPYKFKDPMISKTSCATYVEFVPDSPSPNYPSEIKNVEGNLEIKITGKNLFNKNTVIHGKYLNVNGEEKSSAYWTLSEYMNIENSDKCTYQGIARVGDFGWNVFYDKEKNFISSFKSVVGGETKEIPENAKYVRFCFVVASNDIETFQLELDEKQTTYESYKEQTVIFPLLEGQKMYKDSYLDDDGIHNKRKQITLDGTENITKRANANNSFSFKLPKQSYSGICSHYKSFESPSKIDTENGIYLLSSVDAIFTDLRFTTVEEFKIWLAEQYSAGTPIVFEYIYKNTIDREIVTYTEEQQTAWQQIKALKTYRTVTNISNNQDTNMEITYKNNT